MVTYPDFQSHWLNPPGQRVDADGAAGFQCVDIPRQYMFECFGLPRGGAWGNAIDYWTKPVTPVLEKFYKVASSAAMQGDIVVFNGLPGNPYGHIGTATGGLTATQVEILEQNGSSGNGDGVGGNAIRTRWTDRSRVAGLLRPRGEVIVDKITIVGTPIILNNADNSRIDIFALGSDGGLWQKWFDGKGWQGWVRIGGGLAVLDRVTKADDSSRYDVYGRGVSTDVMHWWFDKTGWHGAESLGIPKGKV